MSIKTLIHVEFVILIRLVLAHRTFSRHFLESFFWGGVLSFRKSSPTTVIENHSYKMNINKGMTTRINPISVRSGSISPTTATAPCFTASAI